MVDQEKDKQLDDLLESLLSSYSTMEPRPGLETRILAQVRGAASKRSSGLWTIACVGAVTVAIVLFAVLIANMHLPRQDTSVQTGLQESPSDAGDGAAKRVARAPHAANTQLVHPSRKEAESRDAENAAILQMANAGHAGPSVDNPIFEPDTTVLDPSPRQEPGPALAQLVSAPSMSIGDLGVRSIEVKELNPAKDLDF